MKKSDIVIGQEYARLVAESLVRLRLGTPRPCGDEQCVAESPEEHGLRRRP